MTRSQVVVPALKNTIRRCFPDTENETVDRLALVIQNQHDIGVNIHWFDNHDFLPVDDSERIKRAAASIRKAAKYFDGLGWHGALALKDYTIELRKMECGVSLLVNHERAGPELSGFLQRIASELVRCANEIDPQAGTVLSKLGDDRPAGKPSGRPKKTIAECAAQGAYFAFEELSGTRPTVTTDRSTGEVGGAFLRFLEKVFEDLCVEASAEHFARKACKEKRSE